MPWPKGVKGDSSAVLTALLIATTLTVTLGRRIGAGRTPVESTTDAARFVWSITENAGLSSSPNQADLNWFGSRTPMMNVCGFQHAGADLNGVPGPLHRPPSGPGTRAAIGSQSGTRPSGVSPSRPTPSASRATVDALGGGFTRSIRGRRLRYGRYLRRSRSRRTTSDEPEGCCWWRHERSQRRLKKSRRGRPSVPRSVAWPLL